MDGHSIDRELKVAQIREHVGKTEARSFLVRIRMKGTPETTATFSRLTDAKRCAQMTEAEMRSGGGT